ncbi:MAG TPA: type III secretion inner membrane ring lipoprotein SctJ, partial [Acidobacteriota bacterium]
VIFAMSLVACSQVINQGLSEDQANEILVVLERNGIQATKALQEGGETVQFTISVPKRDSARAMQILRENDLPQQQAKGFNEVFAKTSLIPTAMEEKAMYLQAVCGELAKTIEAINGVVDARVHVVLPETDVLKQELQGPTTPKAAVLIKYKVRRNGEMPYKPDDIRRLVANSIEALKPDDVTVVSSQVFSDQQPNLIYVGPLKMTEDSRQGLYIVLGAFVFTLLLFGGILIMSGKSAMSLKRENARLKAAAGRSLAKTENK